MQSAQQESSKHSLPPRELNRPPCLETRSNISMESGIRHKLLPFWKELVRRNLFCALLVFVVRPPAPEQGIVNLYDASGV